MLTTSFFERDAQLVAKDLLGKVMRVRHKTHWLSAMILETEAYYLREKASHSSLGYTESRRAMFMPAGTIYMYYSHGLDSLNISVGGEGDAVLIKSGKVHIDEMSLEDTIKIMQKLNPINGRIREAKKLCAGQAIMCKSLNLTVKEWNAKQFDKKRFYIQDVEFLPSEIIQTMRIGIPQGRDEHLPYRFVMGSGIENRK